MNDISDRNIPIVGLVVDIVCAAIAAQKVDAADIQATVTATYATLSQLGQVAIAPEAPAPEPAVAIRASIKPDYIVCLEDGKKLKMLKRYLRTNFDMTPEQYRAKWKLPTDYPMVAPNYAEQRRSLAMKIGLGRKSAATPAPARQRA